MTTYQSPDDYTLALEGALQEILECFDFNGPTVYFEGIDGIVEVSEEVQEILEAAITLVDTNQEEEEEDLD